MAEKRRNRRDSEGSFGSVAASTVDLFVGPFRDAIELSHRIIGRRTWIGARAMETVAPSEKSETTSEESETTSEESRPSADETPAPRSAAMEDVWGVGPSRADALRDLGIESVEQLAEATTEEIAELSIVGEESAEKIRASARDLLE